MVSDFPTLSQLKKTTILVNRDDQQLAYVEFNFITNETHIFVNNTDTHGPTAEAPSRPYGHLRNTFFFACVIWKTGFFYRNIV